MILFCPQAAVNGDSPLAEGLSENDSGVELMNENSPLTAAEPPSPFSPKQNGDPASPQGSACRQRRVFLSLNAVFDIFTLLHKLFTERAKSI